MNENKNKKNKNTHTVKTVSQSYQKIIETNAKTIALTRKRLLTALVWHRHFIKGGGVNLVSLYAQT